MAVLIFFAYVILAAAGLTLQATNGFATLLWAPTGLAISALLIGGRNLWPAIFLGALVVNVYFGAPWAAAVGIASGNTLEALIAVLLLRKASFDLSFSRLRDVINFILLASIVSPIISATFGVSSLYLSGTLGSQNLMITWITWWVGDSLGSLVVAPLILSYKTAVWKKPEWGRLTEILWMSGLFLIISFSIFSGFASQTGIP